MKLTKILDKITYEKNIDIDIFDVDIVDIAYDSRKADEGFIFVAIKGYDIDGHKYAASAYDKGVRVFVVSDYVDLPEDALQIKVINTRKALSKMSANFFEHPSSKIKVIGVTGTKGKTTVSNFLCQVMNRASINTAVIGTNGISYNGKKIDTVNTTPESYDLHKNLRNMVDEGVEYVVMEFSSTGGMLYRTEDVDFEIGIYTNISKDHIGPREHPDFENYLDSKCKLVEKANCAIINIDDEKSDYVISECTGNIEKFSIKKSSSNMAKNIKYLKKDHLLGVGFDYIGDDYSKKFFLKMPGQFTVYNALAVITAANYLGICKDITYEGLKDAFVKGRMQVMDVELDFTIISDYAHNKVSLENALSTLDKYEHNRIICLFGSIGGRSENRRKELAEVASKYSDISVITSDNPDYEDPKKIIDEIASHFENENVKVIKIVDRQEAVKKTIDIAQKGDIVIFAGKGHEDYQIVKGKRLPYNEIETILKYAKERLKREGKI